MIMKSIIFYRWALFLMVTILCNQSLMGQNKSISSGQNSDYILKHRCKNCNGGKIFINRNRPCQNCDYWTKDQRRFNYCNVCRNTGVIYGKNSLVSCNFCKQTGVISTKVNINFKPLFENYFKLDDSRESGQDAMIYSLATDNGSLTLTNLIDYNTLQFLCFSKGSRYVLQLKSNKEVVVVEFENHLEKTSSRGTWDVNENTFSMIVPFKLKSYNDDRTLKLTKTN